MRKSSIYVPNAGCYAESFCLSTHCGILDGKIPSNNSSAAELGALKGCSHRLKAGDSQNLRKGISMGTDITLYAEVFRNGKWEPAPEPTVTEWSEGEIVPIQPIDFGRPYQLFMALADVCQRNLRRTMHAVVKPIAEPRGLPEDINSFYKQHLLKDAYDGCFAHSWLLLKEIIDYDWDGQFVTQKAYVKNQYAHLFQNNSPFPEGQSLYFLLPNWQQEPDTTEVSWIRSYRDYVSCSEWFIEELLKLGYPDKVRIIFWFD